MLSIEDILKVGRLFDQTGEPRPGFLHDETDNFEGQSTAIQPAALNAARKTSPRLGPTRSVNVLLEYEEDAKTGDVRIVQK
jgi:hypothetical protein